MNKSTFGLRSWSLCLLIFLFSASQIQCANESKTSKSSKGLTILKGVGCAAGLAGYSVLCGWIGKKLYHKSLFKDCGKYYARNPLNQNKLSRLDIAAIPDKKNGHVLVFATDVQISIIDHKFLYCPTRKQWGSFNKNSRFEPDASQEKINTQELSSAPDYFCVSQTE